MSDLSKRLNVTTLRSRSKEDLIGLILDLYREIDNVLEAIGYIEVENE